MFARQRFEALHHLETLFVDALSVFGQREAANYAGNITHPPLEEPFSVWTP